MNISNKDKRVIDMNALMEAKLEKMRLEQEAAAQAAFVAGLNAEVVDGEDGDVLGELIDGDYVPSGEGGGENAGEGEPSGDGGGENPKGFRSGIVRNVPKVDTSAIIEKANEEAAGIIENANSEAQSIIENAKAEAESEKEAVIGEARKFGYADGKAQADRELAAALEELKQKERQLESDYAQMYESVEADLVETITDIYQYIFNVDLSGQRQILLHLIEGTMHRIEGTRSFLIHVSPEDAAFVNMQKKTLEAAATLPESIVEVIEDISLSKNQCYIETDGGIFDCGLDTELGELTTKLRLLSYEKNRE